MVLVNFSVVITGVPENTGIETDDPITVELDASVVLDKGICDRTKKLNKAYDGTKIKVPVRKHKV